MRCLVASHKIPEFPSIKTFREEGYPGVSLEEWLGFHAPKGLPNPILTKLTKAFEKASSDPGLLEQMGKLFILPAYLDPDQTVRALESCRETTLKGLKQAGLIK